MKKILFIVIDGLGDRPIAKLGNKTPLEAAKTPNLDKLAERGVCGLIQPWQRGEKPESDTCHLALFGYDPNKFYLGRGPYEAAGLGMKLKPGDVALRGNFATVDKNLVVLDRRAKRISQTQHLVRAISGKTIRGIKFLVRKSFGHRLVLVLRGKNLSPAISDSDPKKTGEKIKKIKPLDNSSKSLFTAEILNKFLLQAHQILKKYHSPANCILTRGAGEMRKTPSFKERYGLKAACIAGGGLYKGIGKILGMDLIKVRGATGFPDTNLKGKFLAAKRNLKKYDFIFLHIKATDNLAEDGNFREKKEFIEKIDKNLKPLLELKNTLIVVTADHSTCCTLKRHCSEPVPLLIYGKGPDKVKEFSERACKKGKLGTIKQLKLMLKIL